MLFPRALISLGFLSLIGGSVLVTQLWTDKAVAPPSAAESPTVPPVVVEVVPVTVGPLSEVVQAVGTLEANESVMLRPEIAGRVTRVRFSEGQTVEEGMVLLELDDSELRARLDDAEAQLHIARLTTERMQQLMQTHNSFISPQQIDQAVSSLRTAQANYHLYRTHLARTKIRAPFSGVVGLRRVSPGDYVQAGQDLVNLEDLQTLKIDFKVPETYLDRLSVKQSIDILTDAYPGKPFSGQVYALDPRVDASSRAVRVRANVRNNGMKLRPGLFAQVSLTVGQVADALLVAEEAIIPQRGKAFVDRVQDQMARWTEVQLGLREQGRVQITGGLEPHQLVVRVGHQKLKDGARISAAGPPL